jgi:hypothetical protein
MPGERVLSILGLAVLCGLWGVFQRWLARTDPDLPGVEDRCGSCAAHCEEKE